MLSKACSCTELYVFLARTRILDERRTHLATEAVGDLHPSVMKALRSPEAPAASSDRDPTTNYQMAKFRIKGDKTHYEEGSREETRGNKATAGFSQGKWGNAKCWGTGGSSSVQLAIRWVGHIHIFSNRYRRMRVIAILWSRDGSS